jgi:phosphoenolpyruvate-protein kinase (PTS system EI component)
MMLDGLLSSGQITAQLREPGVDASGAVRRVFRGWAKKFQALSDPAFQQRADDVADLGRRVRAIWKAMTCTSRAFPKAPSSRRKAFCLPT